MQYRVGIKGLTPLIHHCGASGLDVRSPANVEKSAIAKKRGSNRTEQDEARLRELETMTSIWQTWDGIPTIPEAAFRACIETSARKLKEGPMVREGLTVTETELFEYDTKLGETVEELAKTVQFTVGVVVQRARVLRTRAKFDEWGAVFLLDVDPELVDEPHLDKWLAIGGKRIGLGDWRPEKSGKYGRFEVEEIEPIDDDTPLKNRG